MLLYFSHVSLSCNIHILSKLRINKIGCCPIPARSLHSSHYVLEYFAFEKEKTPYLYFFISKK